MLDRLVGDEELGGDLGVGQAIDDELQDLDLPGGKAGWVGPRAGSYAAGHPLAERSQTFGGERRGGSGAKTVQDVKGLGQGGRRADLDQRPMPVRKVDREPAMRRRPPAIGH